MGGRGEREKRKEKLSERELSFPILDVNSCQIIKLRSNDILRKTTIKSVMSRGMEY